MQDKKTRGRHKDMVPAFIDPIPFPDEITHLAMMSRTLNVALEEANATVHRIDREYMDAKRYMADYRGEIDPHEMFQNELALKQIDRNGAFAVNIWEKIAKLKDSPYFARIDFQMEEYQTPETYYIGRFSFSHENELLIFDWRAPIASMFYDCEVGSAGYDAPMGRIEGNLSLKRRFKIKNGKMEYVLESSTNILDDVLQRELSHTSDKKMKSIISTIQKEQNQIIRDEKSGTLIIQGVAGSGKTSVALHRIAFLLYRFQDKLSAHNVAILSPNKVFSDYISTVLPELGEEPICESGFSPIAEVQLEGIIRFEPDKDPLETDDTTWTERVRFKSTAGFVRQMEQYFEELPTLIFEPEDYTFGRFRISADWIQTRFNAYEKYPLKKRPKLIAEDIRDQFDSDNYMGEEMPTSKTILKRLHAMVKIKSTLTLYKNFYKWLKLPHMFVMPKKQTLEWTDVYPFLYLHSAFEGLRESKLIKHLVIDEMQDYTPIQYAVINRLFPCQKTILGDFGQSVNPNHLHTLADLQHLYHNSSLVELTKSYRSTYEIITFAKSIQQTSKLEAVERHGKAVQLMLCKSMRDQLHKIKSRLADFLSSDNISLGIISKTDADAQNLYTLLAEDFEMRWISPDSTNFSNGISVTSVQMSKGLEFDEVIIADADAITYNTEYDRCLLYIAVTRAMHQLTLFYTGKPSCLLPI